MIASRGASSIAPENTLLAFRLAIEAGADAIATEVHLSSDGELVLIRDDDLARTTDCVGLTSSLTWSELRVCDAGYWYTPNGAARYPYRGLKIGIPRLADLITLIDEVNFDVQLLIEIRAQDREQPSHARRVAEAVARELRDADRLKRIVVSSSDVTAIDTMQRSARRARIAYTADVGAEMHAALAYAIDCRLEAIHVDHRCLGPVTEGASMVAAAHSAGIAVNAGTVNASARMLELARMEVDGIISDDPERLRRVMEASQS